jgi:hypothetical protein
MILDSLKRRIKSLRFIQTYLVDKAGMFADFGGAKIYVMGAGLVSEQGKAKGVYRDPKMMQALKAFWTEWFKRSNAELVKFGMPEMLGSIN